MSVAGPKQMELASVTRSKAVRAVRPLFLVSFLLLGGGCALAPQDAVLNPAVTISKTAAGGGAPVSVEVVDERPSTVAGTRMMGQARYIGAEIKVAEVTPIVEAKAKEALVRNQFVPEGPSAATDRKLKVEIRALDLKTQHTMFSASYLPSAAFKAVARNKADNFEKLYRVDFSEGTMWYNSDDKNNRLLSEAVGKVLDDMLNDPELMGFLAR